MSNPDSLFNRPSESLEENIKPVIENCDIILNEINTILEKYPALKSGSHSKGKKLLQKIKFGNDAMQDLIQLRQKMANYTRALDFFCSVMSVSSQGRVEKLMASTSEGMQDFYKLSETMYEKIYQTINSNQKPEGSTFTDYPDDNLSVWKGLRRELIIDGFTSSFIHENFEVIIRSIKGIDSKRIGLMSENLDPRGGPQKWFSTERPAQWQLVQSAWHNDMSEELAHISSVANLRQFEVPLNGLSQPSQSESSAIGLETDQDKNVTRDSYIVNNPNSNTVDVSPTLDIRTPRTEFEAESILHKKAFSENHLPPIASPKPFIVLNSSENHRTRLKRLIVPTPDHSDTRRRIRFVLHVCNR
jgi:hypothetical protein